MIALAVILLYQSSFCQYPIKKYYKGDSVLIMRVEQMDTINSVFSNMSAKISTLQDSLNRNKYIYDSIFTTFSITKDSFYSWKWKFKENKRIYESFEENQKKLDKMHAASKLMLIFIIIFQFSQLH